MGWGNDSCSNDPGHINKMAAMPINVKNLKKLLLRNRLADVVEMLCARALEYY